MKELLERLSKVQAELKAPKSQYNSHGRYSYRSCEDILEAVKPLLLKHGLTITVADQIHEAKGYMYKHNKKTEETFFNDEINYMYVEATVVISYEDQRTAVTAQAGIDFETPGMQTPQRFGSASSYARKYALNGMFLIDDTKDADATNTHGKTEVTKTVTKKKATKQIKSAMAKAVAEGKKEAVLAKIADYELSEQDVMDIMKGE